MTSSSPTLRRWLRASCYARPEGWIDVFVALGLAALYLALLLGSVGDLGYARDEGFYFQAARSYAKWFSMLAQDPSAALANADRYWRVNHEHPALMKSLFALSKLMGFDRWGLFEQEGTSYRFAGMLVSSGSIGLVYLWGARARGRLVGFAAAVLLAAIPRFFYHAHLACFDIPVVTMWLLCAYVYWRSLQRGGHWCLWVGVCFGLALNTKHNAWFLPIVFLLHAFLIQVPGVARGVSRGLLRRRTLASLFSMATAGPLLFFAGWPWLWRDTVARVVQYANFHLHHVYYNMEFLGQNYFQPPMPRSYAFVMTAATVPLVTLSLFGFGLLVLAHGECLRPVIVYLRELRSAGLSRDVSAVSGLSNEPLRPSVDPGTSMLWGLAIAVQFAPWLLSGTPIFGGTKHWMTTYPFLVLFAGSGVGVLSRGLRAGWMRGRLRAFASHPGLDVVVLTSLVAAPVVQTAQAHPWALSSYSPLVGGAAGGANLGLNRGFWGYTTGAVVDYLNRRVPPHARVYPHDTAGASWDMLKRDGRLRRDIVATWGVARADFGLYHHEMHMRGQEYQNWVAFDTAVPDHIAGLDGVPVIWVYRRPAPAVKP